MSIFVDTSALYALLVSTDQGHVAVSRAFQTALKSGQAFLSTSYIQIETVALLQGRIGLDAVRDLQQKILPVINMEWITESVHRRAVARLFNESRRGLSLVDCVSFEVMKERGLTHALTLDRHFEQCGFVMLPRR